MVVMSVAVPIRFALKLLEKKPAALEAGLLQETPFLLSCKPVLCGKIDGSQSANGSGSII